MAEWDVAGEQPLDPWAVTGEAPEAPITAKGLYKAVDRGAAETGAQLAALPRTVMSLIGRARGVPPEMNVAANRLPNAEQARETIQRDLYGGEAPYEPQNRAERYAMRGGEYLANAVIPGGAVARVANVALPAIAQEAAKEAGAGELGQVAAALAGGAGAVKLANVAERGLTKLPSFTQAKAVTDAQYGEIERIAMGRPFLPSERDNVVSQIENALHAQNLRPNKAGETYGVLNELRAGVPGKSSDVADLVTARQKLGNISGQDGVAAQAARGAIDAVIDAKIPGLGEKLAIADRNYNAWKVAEDLTKNFHNAEVRNAPAHSGLNLGNKMRAMAAQIATNPNRTRFMTPDEVGRLEALSKGTFTQNTLRYVGNLLGGGGGLGAAVVGGLGSHYAGGNYPETGSAALLPIITGLALRKAYNRSVARQAQGLAQQSMARAPMSGGAQYTAPLSLAGTAGRAPMLAGPELINAAEGPLQLTVRPSDR